MSDSRIEDGTAAKASGEVRLLDLPQGRGLKAAETSSITRRSLTSVILFAGTADCGKTTLLASIYLLFQRGPFAGYNFAGSDTLVGFEDRVSLARTASGRDTPATPRTSISEFLHLRVRRDDFSQPVREVILCDLWGEDFREAKDSSEACRKLGIIQTAHRFVLLIDGGKLAKKGARQSAKNEPLMLLRSCLETEMLGCRSDVDVLFTKWDVVASSKESREISDFAQHVEDEIRRRIGNRVGRLHFARVASHPFGGSFSLGHGLAELFPSWVEAAWQERPEEAVLRKEAVSFNEFDRYCRRRLPELFALE